MSHPAPHSVPAAERRLRRLVEANRLVMAELSLPLLLPRIVEVARQVVEADYAALGVIGTDGTLEQFHHPEPPGPPATAGGAEESGPLRVLLGKPTRTGLPSLSADPHLAGVALSDLELSAFLAVPIGSGSSLHGTLYLANRAGGAAFSAEDEYLLTAFAATAGVAVGNARRYADARRRQDWSEASAEVGHQLLASGSNIGVLEQIAESVARLAEADTVQIVLPVPDLEDTLEFAVSRGAGADQARGLRYPAAGSIAWEAMHKPGGLVLDEVQGRLKAYADARSQLPITNLMAFPLQGAGQARGSVVVCRSNHQPFTPAEVEMAQAFTNQAALALELADARADRSRLGLLEDRDRISRDLQHQVLQKLFAASVTVQGAATLSVNPAVRAQLVGTISTLDDTIRSIRSTIFGLQTPRTNLAAVASRVVTTIAQLSPTLRFAPTLQLSGPLDTAVDQELAADLEAVLREALGTITRRATARSATVQVSADAVELDLCVTDDAGDADGPVDSALSSRLVGLGRRAESRGGHLDVDHSPTGGFLLRWAVPLWGPPGG